MSMDVLKAEVPKLVVINFFPPFYSINLPLFRIIRREVYVLLYIFSIRRSLIRQLKWFGDFCIRYMKYI